MHLHSPTSAMLSALIFNALTAVATGGAEGRALPALGADALLRRNLLIRGVGGVIVPSSREHVTVVPSVVG